MERHGRPGHFLRALLNALGPVALVAAALSIWLNWELIRQVTETRRQVRDAVDQALVQLEQASGSELRYDLPVRQSIPVSTTISLRRTVVIPIRTTLPVDTQVTVALPLVGNVNVPIKADVPVNIDVPIELREDFPIRTEVPLNMNVPIRIRLSDLGGQAGLDGLRAWLRDLRRSLE